MKNIISKKKKNAILSFISGVNVLEKGCNPFRYMIKSSVVLRVPVRI